MPPWWAVLFLAVFVGVEAASLRDDARARRPAWWLALELVTVLASVLMGVGLFVPSLAARWGGAWALLLAGATLWRVHAAHVEIPELWREIEADDELGPGEKRVLAWGGLLVGVALVTPPLVAGAVLVVRWLRA